jgi:Domain of unknown function (DUF4258)
MGTVSKLVTLRKAVLSPSDAQERIRDISFDSDRVIFMHHAEERMEQRDISRPDVLEVLRSGYVDDTPREEFAGEWKCKVTSKLRGRTAGVVTVVVDAESQLIIVTVEWEDLR